MTLGQITDFRRPVVHLGIDIDCVFAVPRRQHLLIPDPLQISG